MSLDHPAPGPPLPGQPLPGRRSLRRALVSRQLLAAIGVVVVVSAGLAVRAATSSKANVTSPQRQRLIAAAALPACPTTTGSGSVAAGLPALRLPCLGNGPSVDLARLRGPMVVNIWAGTCTQCRVEAPLVAAFAAQAKGKVAVLGVVDGNYPGETWDDALDASRGLGLRYPSVFDANGQLVGSVRAIGIPVSLLIKPDGTVAYTEIGTLHSGQLQELVGRYLGIAVDTTGDGTAAGTNAGASTAGS